MPSKIKFKQNGSTNPTAIERRLADNAPSEHKRRAAKLLFGKGLGYKAVATVLRLSPNTVRDWNRLYKKGNFNVKPSANQFRYPDEAKELVRTLRRQGLSWLEISERTGINMSSCRKWVKSCSENVSHDEDAGTHFPDTPKK